MAPLRALVRPRHRRLPGARLRGALARRAGRPPPEIDAQPHDPTPPVTPDRPAEATWVSIRVEGLPPGSRILLDGLPASSTFRVPRGGQHVLEITAPGYEDRRIEVTADRNRTLHAALRPAEGTVRTGP
ncbi:MAG: PEGA domain-containing protein [Sandaracinaceae bacterium]|nr:PEGA domain-containing protein [Sandaracinaceae bacterium]